MDQAPVPYTCGTIDSILKSLENIESESSDLTERDSSLDEIAQNINYWIGLAKQELEEVRSGL